MTDNEIIKALEYKTKVGCELCDIKDKECCTTCVYGLAKQTLDLIKRQKTEVESLKEALKDLRREMSYMTNPNAIGDRHEMGCW